MFYFLPWCPSWHRFLECCSLFWRKRVMTAKVVKNVSVFGAGQYSVSGIGSGSDHQIFPWGVWYHPPYSDHACSRCFHQWSLGRLSWFRAAEESAFFQLGSENLSHLCGFLCSAVIGACSFVSVPEVETTTTWWRQAGGCTKNHAGVWSSSSSSSTSQPLRSSSSRMPHHLLSNSPHSPWPPLSPPSRTH